MQQRVSVQKAVPSAYAWAFKEALLDLLIAHVPCALSVSYTHLTLPTKRIV